MRLRKLALAVGLASALGAEMASALGLGEIKLLSTLNQPLQAEIKLLQTRELTENEILISLAGRDDFQRAGIERVFFLSDLRFEVDLEAKAGPVIRVSSRKPVMEPYLNFLLESQWPNGRILREYTLLMDLPVFSEDRAAAVQSARTTSAKALPAQPAARTQATAPSEPQSTTPEPQTRSSVSRSSSAPRDGVYGPVGSNDTLWEIALKVRPGREYSVQQTMLAIQRLNPEAFINGNINLLRKGQVLRVPASSDIDSVGARQAISEVAQQNSQWSGAAGEPVGAQLDGSKRQGGVSGSTAAGVSGRLKVSGADASESLQAGRAAGEVGGDTEALQNELAISLEQLDSSRRENSELKDRVTELEDQIGTMERLLEVSSQELRALQLGTQKNTEAAIALEAEAEPQAQVPSPQEVKAAPAKPDASKVVRSAKPKEPSFMDMVMDNILYIGGAGLAIFAAVLLLLRRRQSTEDEGLEPIGNSVSSVDNEADARESVLGAGVADDFDAAGEEDFSLSDDDDAFDLDDVVPTEAETDDVVGEADIYIAYGKFDQAEDMLQRAIDADATNTAARLKLMEVYLETQDADKFDYQYTEIVMQGDDASIARADDLKAQLRVDAVEDELFSGLDEESSADDEFAFDSEEFSFDKEALDFDEVDLELGLDDLDGGDEAAKGDDLVLGENFGLSFESELTAAEPKSDAELSDAELEVVARDPQDDEFAFDLDLDDIDTEVADDLEIDLELGLDDKAVEDTFSLALEETELEEPGFEAAELETPEKVLASAGDDQADSLESLDLELPADVAESAEISLDLELDDADEDAFDLDEGDWDLAALDEEVDALTSNMDFVGDVFGEDDKLASLDDELLSLDEELSGLNEELSGLDEELSGLDEELTLDAALPLMDFDSETGDVGLAEAGGAELEVEAESTDSLELDEGGLDEALAEEGALDLDLSADFAELDELALEDVPTLGAGDTPEKEIAGSDFSEALDLEAFESFELDAAETLEAGAEAIDSEDAAEPEFDLVADLGLNLDEVDEGDRVSDEEMFAAALSGLPSPEDAFGDEDIDAELDFLADTDEAATKLDLARAYIDMGDQDGAKDILGEVVVEGNDVQKQEAEELLTRIG